MIEQTSCPEGSKMTDFTYTFKDGGDLSKEFECVRAPIAHRRSARSSIMAH